MRVQLAEVRGARRRAREIPDTVRRRGVPTPPAERLRGPAQEDVRARSSVTICAIGDAPIFLDFKQLDKIPESAAVRPSLARDPCQRRAAGERISVNRR
jgi:hypothetical protein